ncbi:unnamed protein product [Agarophyton chilense]
MQPSSSYVTPYLRQWAIDSVQEPLAPDSSLVDIEHLLFGPESYAPFSPAPPIQPQCSTPPQSHSPAHDLDSPSPKTSGDKPPPKKRQKDTRTRAEIRRDRAARNRSSARRSRLRKKAQSEQENLHAQMVQQRNASLKTRVANLRTRMLRLQNIVAHMTNT